MKSPQEWQQALGLVVDESVIAAIQADARENGIASAFATAAEICEHKIRRADNRGFVISAQLISGLRDEFLMLANGGRK